MIRTLVQENIPPMLTKFYNACYWPIGLKISSPARFFTFLGLCTAYGAVYNYRLFKSING